MLPPVSPPRLRSICVALVVLLLGMPSAYAAPGETLWIDRTEADRPHVRSPRDLVLSPDGSILYVVGEKDGESSVDVRVVAYDAASGDRIWRRLYDGGLDDAAALLALSPDGTRLFVAGSSALTGSSRGIFALALDAHTGALVWRRTALHERPDGPLIVGDIAASMDTVFVAVDGDGPLSIHAVDASTGDSLWRVNVRCRIGNIQDIVISGERVIVGGWRLMRLEPLDDNAWVAAYDTGTGDRVWRRTYRSENGLDGVHSLRLSPDGSHVYAAGRIDGDHAGGSVFVRAIDVTSGDSTWEWLSAPLGSTTDDGAMIETGPDGTIYVSYLTYLGSPGTTVVDALDPDGEPRWPSRTVLDDPGQYFWVQAIAVSPDGARLYLTGNGSMESDERRGLLTVAFDAQHGGPPLWHHHRRSGGGTDVAVSPDSGSIYVAGYRRLVDAYYVEAFSAA